MQNSGTLGLILYRTDEQAHRQGYTESTSKTGSNGLQHIGVAKKTKRP